MKKLYVSLPESDNHGWGICGKNIIKELKKRGNWEVEILPESIDSGITVLDCNPPFYQNIQIAGPLFICINDISLRPWKFIEASKNHPMIGYCFFEEELPDEAIENAKHYDLILAGSTWCADKLRAKGIMNVDVLLQGVDPELFYPLPPKEDDGKFTIFSGGKFEYRKGQDIVLVAFKLLQDKYPNLHLLTCWKNHWDFSMNTMAKSEYIKYERIKGDWEQQLEHICKINDIDFKRVLWNHFLPNSSMRDIFSQTDLGVFPNRCEGGTNLVLMEYMACGRPVLASLNTGHKDLFPGLDKNIDFMHDPEILASEIEWEIEVYNQKYQKVLQKIQNAFMKQFTWSNTVDRLLYYVERACAVKATEKLRYL